MKELEQVFDKLQARIEELQARRQEEAANRSSRELMELESRYKDQYCGSEIILFGFRSFY
jgi:hypothetical protein